MTPDRHPVEISTILRQIEDQLRRNAPAGVVINCVLGATSLVVDTDAGLLRRVLDIFAENALKHTTRGSITFGFDVNGDELYFYVKDTGVGVAADDQDEIFDRQGSSLAQASEIVTALGGEIGIESRGPGKGSSFWFTIPYEETDETPVETPRVEPDPLTVSFPQLQRANMPHDITILIAEDNESNYTLFKSFLESRYNLIHAYNGREAVDIYRENSSLIDLILMDINMPIMDGYEATREIRQISSEVPIVAVTAYAFTSDKQRIFENGFNAYVSKPISLNRLSRIINDLTTRP